MRDFIRAMQNGEVQGMPIGLRDKVWTKDELDGTRVTKLDSSAGPRTSRLLQLLFFERILNQ